MMSSTTARKSNAKLTYSQALLKKNPTNDPINIKNGIGKTINTITGSVKKNLKVTILKKKMNCSMCNKEVYNDFEEFMCYECEHAYDNCYSVYENCDNSFDIANENCDNSFDRQF